MASKPWSTKVSHARFVVGAFSSQQMLALGEVLANSIRARIQGGLNVDDAPAKPLKPGYAKFKRQKGKNPVRDWTMTGRTLQALRVLSANENQAVIGFNNPIAGRIAHFNNLKERAFGVSPNDSKTIVAAVRAAVRQAHIVRVESRVA